MRRIMIRLYCSVAVAIVAVEKIKYKRRSQVISVKNPGRREHNPAGETKARANPSVAPVQYAGIFKRHIIVKRTPFNANSLRLLIMF